MRITNLIIFGLVGLLPFNPDNKGFWILIVEIDL